MSRGQHTFFLSSKDSVSFVGHTTGLLPLRCTALPNRTRLLQIDVPVRGLALVVLQCECKNRTALLDGIFSLGVFLQCVCDPVESGGRGPGVCEREEVSMTAGIDTLVAVLWS